MKSGIYTIGNKISHKVYVGQASDLIERKSEHFRALRRNIHSNRHLQASYNKHGKDAFEWNVIELCEINLLTEREQFHADRLRAEGVSLYNVGKFVDAPTRGLPGPNLGKKMSDEARKKLSVSRMGLPAWNKGIKTGKPGTLLGKPMSPETKQKLSAAKQGRPAWNKGIKTGKPGINLGKKFSEETKAKISAAKKGKPSPKKGVRTGSPAWNKGIKTGKPRTFLGRKHSEKAKAKMIAAKKGIPSPLKGRSLPEETRRKISEARTGSVTVSGENNPYAKLTWETVREIRKLYETENLKIAAIARKYDLDWSTISRIVKYITWKE